MTLIVRYGGTTYTEVERDAQTLREVVWRKLDDDPGWLRIATPDGHVHVLVTPGIPIAIEERTGE